MRSLKWGYTASVALIPYMVMKTLWAISLPVLATAQGMKELHESMLANGDPITAFLYPYGIDTTVLLGLIASVLAIALVRPWGRRIPPWILILPALTGGMAFIAVSLSVLFKLVKSSMDGSFHSLTGPFSPWIMLPAYGGFATWGVSISLAALSYYKRVRLVRSLG
ncbi:hypothetical protein [Cohnella nanjingensis]|uniref:DUF3995 domain-containing protein n=1 Tax=Cohnella nanjingensis TaxID=1387779 RepID=A0A7X0RL68_9BACL|nr:hypothetical protein [Cohnella nanjingensis]MBB6669512.1 hypothetical protein [Cohnella nanjingensis]